MTITRTGAIFGDIFSPADGWKNTLLILTRYFIWKQKFGQKVLSFIAHKNFLTHKLKSISEVLKFKNRENELDRNWSDMLMVFNIE